MWLWETGYSFMGCCILCLSFDSLPLLLLEQIFSCLLKFRGSFVILKVYFSLLYKASLERVLEFSLEHCHLDKLLTYLP